MSAYQDPIQRTKIGIAAMMGALGNSTFNTLVCMAIHGCILLSVLISIVLPIFAKPCIDTLTFQKNSL